VAVTWNFNCAAGRLRNKVDRDVRSLKRNLLPSWANRANSVRPSRRLERTTVRGFNAGHIELFDADESGVVSESRARRHRMGSRARRRGLIEVAQAEIGTERCAEA